jgi:hypothetical protein
MARPIYVGALIVAFAMSATSVATAREDSRVRSYRPAAAAGSQLPRWVRHQPLLSTLRRSRVDLRDVTFFADGAVLLRSAGTRLSCPYDTVCLYEHRDFGGARIWFGGCCTTFNLRAYGWNDIVSSWINRKRPGYPACLYRDANLVGWRICLQPASASTYVGNFYNDRASSFRIGG